MDKLTVLKRLERLSDRLKALGLHLVARLGRRVLSTLMLYLIKIGANFFMKATRAEVVCSSAKEVFRRRWPSLFSLAIGTEALISSKMDIEGGELQALKGMGGVLARSLLMIMFVECNPEVLRTAGSDAG